MNQGKLNMVKQKMARLKSDILGISKLKWAEMSEFNSDDHYIYYCGQESLRRNPHSQQESEMQSGCLLPGCILKNNRMFSVCFQGIICNKLMEVTEFQLGYLKS